jgi:ribosomal protein S20
MPIIKSAIKRARQTLTRRSRNLQVKRAIKQDVTALHTAISTGEAENITTSLSMAYSQIDRAVKKGTLHKNTAARKKSALAKAIAQASPSAEAKPAKTTTKGATKASTAKKPAAKKTVAKKPAAKKPAAKKAPATKSV